MDCSTGGKVCLEKLKGHLWGAGGQPRLDAVGKREKFEKTPKLFIQAPAANQAFWPGVGLGRVPAGQWLRRAAARARAQWRTAPNTPKCGLVAKESGQRGRAAGRGCRGAAEAAAKPPREAGLSRFGGCPWQSLCLALWMVPRNFVPHRPALAVAGCPRREWRPAPEGGPSSWAKEALRAQAPLGAAQGQGVPRLGLGLGGKSSSTATASAPPCDSGRAWGRRSARLREPTERLW